MQLSVQMKHSEDLERWTNTVRSIFLSCQIRDKFSKVGKQVTCSLQQHCESCTHCLQVRESLSLKPGQGPGHQQQSLHVHTGLKTFGGSVYLYVCLLAWFYFFRKTSSSILKSHHCYNRGRSLPQEKDNPFSKCSSKKIQ